MAVDNLYLYESTRASVVPVQSPIMTKRPKMTKNQYPSLDQYIYHRYIYISRPPREEQTDRCTDCRLKE